MKPVWICKPNDLSRGRKIFLFKDIVDLVYDTPTVVQKYIANPYLISSYKWDMRVYVLITSYHPLTVYAYREGLARFSTEPYDIQLLDNKFAHLTNSSINKFSPNFAADKPGVGSGCKWSFDALERTLRQQGVDYSAL